MSPSRFDGVEPGESHEFRDREGHPCAMADAWSVVVTREPEWDDYTRGEALADLEVDLARCSECGVEGAVVAVPAATRHWTWGDGRKFEVTSYRCLSCAALDTVKRDATAEAEKHKAVRGVYAPLDGLRLVVRPVD